MSVPVYAPQIQVLLKKNIGRATVGGNVAASTRFEATPRAIDLTPYLGDTGSVVVQRSTRQACGMFSITLADNFAPGELETLAGLVEPMDCIDISMAHDASQYAGGKLPIMLRGFVTEIRRSEAMQGNGVNAKPVRRVIISGQDYGKILVINQIAYLANMTSGQNLLTYFKLFVNYHIGSNTDQPASDFIKQVITAAIDPFLADMRKTAEANGVAQGVSPIMDIKVDASVTTGVVSPYGTNKWPGGTIYDLMKYYGDSPTWNELYVEDRSDAPYVVYRPNPFKDINGNLIQAMSEPPTTVSVTDEDLVSLDVMRTDAGVANYYWVDCSSYILMGGWQLQANQANGGDQTYFLTKYPNCSPFLYGFRRLAVESQQGSRVDGQPASVVQKGHDDVVGFFNDRRATLMAQNKDNVVYEAGEMKLRGNENIKHGCYVNLTRGTGKITSSYYAYQVRHVFLPYKSYTTTVTFDRGTNFIDRVQRSGSPYLAEMSVGGVYQ
jgi:hypothetical protein